MTIPDYLTWFLGFPAQEVKIKNLTLWSWCVPYNSAYSMIWNLLCDLTSSFSVSLLLNRLLCLLCLFPFFLFPFVIRGITFFPQHDSIFQAKIVFWIFFCFYFPSKHFILNWLFGQIQSIMQSLISNFLFCYVLVFTLQCTIKEIHIFAFLLRAVWNLILKLNIAGSSPALCLLWHSTAAVAESRNTTGWSPNPRGWEKVLKVSNITLIMKVRHRMSYKSK